MTNSPELPGWQEKYKTHLSILEEIKENQDLLQFDNRYIKILFDKKKEEKIRERHQEGKFVESLLLQKLN
ncbi:MAG TPA: hypothetical protein ENH75_09790 [archaeon]|nr:hypothetical protein [archaeon]